MEFDAILDQALSHLITDDRIEEVFHELGDKLGQAAANQAADAHQALQDLGEFLGHFGIGTQGNEGNEGAGDNSGEGSRGPVKVADALTLDTLALDALDTPPQATDAADAVNAIVDHFQGEVANAPSLPEILNAFTTDHGFVDLPVLDHFFGTFTPPIEGGA